jgi:AcrR family transcriptional regulator
LDKDDCCALSTLGPGRADIRRQKLVASARALFAAHGFHATGMAQIAAASGIKVGQIYRDFDSKEQIVGAIVEADLAAFLDEAGLRRAVDAHDLAAVRRWIGEFVCGDTDEESRRLMPEICAEAARNDKVAAIMQGVNARVVADLVTALTAFAPQPDKAARVEVVAELILTLAIGLTSQRGTNTLRAPELLCARIEALIDAELTALSN